MDWGVIPILIAFITGYVGVCLMAVAFVLVARQGGWRQSMRSGPDGRWSLARRLMFAGAVLSIIFSLTVTTLFAIPGGIPWMNGSDGGTTLISFLSGLAAVWYFIIRPA